MHRSPWQYLPAHWTLCFLRHALRKAGLAEDVAAGRGHKAKARPFDLAKAHHTDGTAGFVRRRRPVQVLTAVVTSSRCSHGRIGRRHCRRRGVFYDDDRFVDGWTSAVGGGGRCMKWRRGSQIDVFIDKDIIVNSIGGARSLNGLYGEFT